MDSAVTSSPTQVQKRPQDLIVSKAFYKCRCKHITGRGAFNVCLMVAVFSDISGSLHLVLDELWFYSDMLNIMKKNE